MGRRPSDDTRRACWRHACVLLFVAAHVPGVLVLGAVEGHPAGELVREVLPVLVLGTAALAPVLPRRWRTSAAALALMTGAGTLIHASGASPQAHLYYFVALAVLAVYDDWLPYVVAVVFVLFDDPLLHLWHGEEVLARDVTPAYAHGGFVLATSIVTLAIWHLHERERAATERALRESEARFRLPFEAASIGMAVVRPDGRYLEVNDALCRMVGYTADELLARTFQDISVADDLDEDLRLLDRCLAGEIDCYELRKRYRRKDGGLVWANLTVALVRDARDRPRYFVSQTVDVTDRVVAEEALAASEQRLTALVEYGTDLIAIVDAAGHLRYASPAIERVLGAKPAERIGQAMLDYVHPEDRERLLLEASTIVDDSEAKVRSQFRAAHVDGTWRWIEATMVNRLHDPAVQGVVINSRDVSEQVARAAELAHQASHDALTGLANRTLLEDRLPGALSGARRRGEVLAALFVDLDRFKRVNDELGHSAGDVLLRAVADRLRSCVRPEDTVARIGGDEFVVLAALADEPAAAALADRLCAVLAEPVDVGTGLVAVGASVGVALHGDVDAGLPEELVRAADFAMYRAKADGRGSWARYAPGTPQVPLHSDTPAARVDAQWRQLLESSVEAIAVHVEGTIVAVSRRALDLLGAPDEQAVVGRSVFELVAPDSRHVSYDRRAVMKAGGWPATQQVRIVTFSGAVVATEVTSHPVLWKDQVGVQLSMRPLSSGWNALAQTALDTIGLQSESVIVTDMDLQIVAWNGHAADCYGWPAEEVLGRSLVDVIGWGNPESEVPAIRVALRDDGVWRGVSNHRDRDGRPVAVETTCRIVRDANGDPIGLVNVQVPLRVGPPAVDESVLAELAGAIDTQLVVHYQPIVRASDGNVVKVEALVRWNHPERGLLPPGRFVPQAEGTPLIGRITERVLRLACAQVVAWRSNILPGLELSVNVSANELAERALLRRVTEALAASGLPADALWLEVTETSIADEPERALKGLRELQQLGCRVALDDFGTGFATLAQLHRFPVHALKIDRLFVDGLTDNPGDAAIVRSVIALGRDLGLTVVAEGVEDEEQLHALRLLGCDLLQGYLLGRPAAPESVPAWAVERPKVVPPADEEARIAALEQLAVLDTRPEPGFDRLTRLAARLCDAPMALISIVDRDRQWFKSTYGVAAVESPLAWSFCRHAIEAGDEPFVVSDASSDPRFDQSPLVVGPPAVRAYAGVPLRLGHGHTVGTLCVLDTVPRSFTRDQLEDLVALADQVVSELDVRQSVAQLDARTTRLLSSLRHLGVGS